MNIIQKARSRLLIRSPFFGTLLLSTPLVETRDVPTAATDMASIYWNPDFFDTLTVDEAMFVLAHEVMHILFLHGTRMGSRDPQVWNMACDYAINGTLAANGMTMPACGLLDPAFTGQAAEHIYDVLAARKPPPDSGALQGDLLPVPRDKDAVAKIATHVRGRVAQAITAARLAGNVPAGIEQVIETILHPQVPWQQMLRHYMTARDTTRTSWDRRNRRFKTVYLPTRGGNRLRYIGVIIDTSGSIGQRIMDALASEVQAIGTDIGAETVHVKFADTETQREQVFRHGEPIVLQPKGGGGTDMRVPLAEFEETPPDVCVLLTDGYTPWPSAEPSYPLIVCCTTHAKVPVGMEVRINV